MIVIFNNQTLIISMTVTICIVAASDETIKSIG